MLYESVVFVRLGNTDDDGTPKMPGNLIGKEAATDDANAVVSILVLSSLNWILYSFASITSLSAWADCIRTRVWGSLTSPDSRPVGGSLRSAQRLLADELVDVRGVLVLVDAGGEVAVRAFQFQRGHGSWATSWDEARTRGLGDWDARLLAWGDEVQGMLHIRVLRLVAARRQRWLRAVGSGRGRGSHAAVLRREVGRVETWQRGQSERRSTA